MKMLHFLWNFKGWLLQIMSKDDKLIENTYKKSYQNYPYPI